jgi:hypothetical protein
VFAIMTRILPARSGKPNQERITTPETATHERTAQDSAQPSKEGIDTSAEAQAVWCSTGTQQTPHVFAQPASAKKACLRYSETITSQQRPM